MVWVDSTLGEICDIGGGEIKTGPFGSQLHQSDYEEFGTPVVMPKDIIEGRVDETGIARVNENHVERLSQHKLKLGDIVYGRRGDIGRQALTRQENVGWLCGTGCLKISLGHQSPIDSRYLHLYLKQDDVVSWIANQAIGATMPNLNTSILRNIPVRYPAKLEEQLKVVNTLFAYDNLIENNTRRIAILETIAQNLYREWFINFRFPNHEQTQWQDTPQGKIPLGWNACVVSDVIQRKKAGAKYTQDNVKDSGDVIVIDQSRAEALGYHDNEPDHLATSTNPIAIFGDHTCKMQLMVEPFSVGPNVVPFIPKLNYPAAYIFYLVRSLVETQEYKRHWTELNAKEVLLADYELAERFSNLVGPFLQKINTLQKANVALRKSRDTLLPQIYFKRG